MDTGTKAPAPSNAPAAPNKWKLPDWVVPGAKCEVTRGRIVPKGTTGIVIYHYGTGSGPKAYIWTGDPQLALVALALGGKHNDVIKRLGGFEKITDSGVLVDVWVCNIDPA